MTNKKTLLALFVLCLVSLYLAPMPASSQAEISNQPPGSLVTDQHEVFLPSINKYLFTPSPNYGSWPMVAANLQRTSWTRSEVYGNLNVVWYRPIEAYISQNVQIIAEYGNLYLSTSRGLYVLKASNGSIVWRFDTEFPLGNSPTVIDGVVYVGGHDRKIHALDARDGTHLWAFEGAGAGFDTNPLVVDGKVIAGNRDGYMYAIADHGQPNRGQLVWKYKTGGPIHLSVAYKDGIIYFAADDNYAYALQASTGALVWKSQKMPGDGYHSYWPVIYRDKVIFSASISYRLGIEPGMRSITPTDGSNYYSTYRHMEAEDILPGLPEGSVVGPIVANQVWANGHPVVDASNVTEYLENNPNPHPNKHKPWRRTFVVLNRSNGSEYTFDSDNDGYPEYLPAGYWGTNSGNRYPPVVGADDMLYLNAFYQKGADSQGKVMGWNIGSKYLSVIGGQGATAEPQALSAGGNLIYRSLIHDRVGDYFDIHADGIRQGTLWSYNLDDLAPGYDEMWTILPGWPRAQGWYKGITNSINGIYHDSGDQHPNIPYMGMVFSQRSNAVIAFGSGANAGKLPTLRIQNTVDPINTPTTTELQTRLEEQIEKMISAGHLRPGYYNNGQFVNYSELATYFDNPGDTLYTLSIAYPHLSAPLQAQLRTYLQNEFNNYFNPTMYSNIGWAEGAPREALPMPPEIQAVLPDFPKYEFARNYSWTYPQHNFYGMWKYALIFPEQAVTVYELAKAKLIVPVPPIATTSHFQEKPYELNAYIAGYIGFLNLQEAANKTAQDSQLRTSVSNELNRLLALRVSIFSKDTMWVEDYYQRRIVNISRNFMNLVPELGNYLNQNAFNRVQEAINEYIYITPYWFVSRYEGAFNESAWSSLYNVPALFKAKAFIMHDSRAELTKYLDAPAFERGDLHYIQNLVTAIEAGS